MQIDVNGGVVIFDLYTLLIWLIVGLIAGVLASAVTRNRSGLITNIFLGILGAIVGGFFLSLLSPIISINVQPDWLRTLVTAFIGAVLLILIFRLVAPGYYRRRV